MLAKIGISIAVVLILFLSYVASRPGHFSYERSGVINAPAEKIFPYVSDFRKGGEWSPYEKRDPNMKKTFSGPDGAVGSKMTFEGNSDVGAGSLVMTKVEPNKSVELTLHMTKPMEGTNNIVYTLTPEGEGTRFSWAMSGEGGFVFKLMDVFIDCEKMIAGDFEQGIANLKQVVEAK